MKRALSPTSNHMNVIGQNIKQRRKELQLTQAQLAQIMNYSKDHISHIECGLRGMTVDTLLAFCEALNTDCNSLVKQHESSTSISEIEDMLLDRPKEYLDMVKSLILFLDKLPSAARTSYEEALRTHDGA